MQSGNRLTQLLRRGRAAPVGPAPGSAAGQGAPSAERAPVPPQEPARAAPPASPEAVVPARDDSAVTAASRLREAIRDQHQMSQIQQPSQTPVDDAEGLAPNMSVLRKGLKMKGVEIDAPGEDLTIEGEMEGSVVVGTVIIPEGGVVIGEIKATTVKAWGAVRGNVRADNVFIYKGASISGSVKCDVFGFQPGASMKASIECDASEQIVESAAPATQQRSAQAGQQAFGDSDFGGLRVVKGGA